MVSVKHRSLLTFPLCLWTHSLSVPGSHDFVLFPLVSGDDGIPLQGFYSLGNMEDKVGGFVMSMCVTNRWLAAELYH